MGKHMRVSRAWAAVLAGAALVAAGCGSEPEPAPSTPAADPSSAAATAPAALQRYYEQSLDWAACDGNYECAELTVPKDYAKPEAGDTTIAVVRQEPGDHPNGYLVLNPGGPGGSGIDYAEAASAVVSPAVMKAYNVVGFDPRGVGRSEPIDCLTDAELDEWIAEDGEPDSAAEQKRLLAEAEEFGLRCKENDPDLVPYLDSESVVKDLDVLRAALGEDQLNYLGFSYGTFLGALYAEEFGPQTGRMVLDGVLPPHLSEQEVGLGQAKGFEDALRRYVADCQKQADCPVAAPSVAAGEAKMQRFLESLDDKPLPTDSGRKLDQALGAGAVLYHLYFPYSGDWDLLTEGLRDAFAGDGTKLLSMYDTRLERSPDGSYRTNSQEVFYAVNCLDRSAGVAVEDLAAIADRWAQAAPTFGRYLAWSQAVCAKWPVDAKGAPREVTGSEAGPILLVATAHDPATPQQWAQALADRMPNAHLIVWESDGHTAYTNGSACVDDAVDAYLVDGTLPESGTVCQ